MKKLTNEELAIEFAKISGIRNCFDRLVALKKFKRQYHHSDFYRATYMPIAKAFSAFTTNKLLTAIITFPMSIRGENLALEVNDFMNTLDIEVAMHRLFGSIDYSKLETALKTVTGADKDWDYLKTMLPEIQSKLRSMFTPQ